MYNPPMCTVVLVKRNVHCTDIYQYTAVQLQFVRKC